MNHRVPEIDRRYRGTCRGAGRSRMVGPATMAFAGLLAVSAYAQTTVPGYTQSRVGDVVEIRPETGSDGEVAIRVYPPSPTGMDANRYLDEWAAAHPPTGTLQTKTLPEPRLAQGVRVTGRQYRSGQRVVNEMIALVPLKDGRFQVEATAVPVDRQDIQASVAAAAGRVIAAIGRGEYLVGAVESAPAASGASAAPVKDKAPAVQSTKRKDGVDAGPAPSGGRDAEPAPPPETPAQTRARVLAAAGAIETVGFYTRTSYGVGGMLLYLPTPVVLFKDGTALLDISDLKRIRSIAEDRVAHPAHWIRWRRERGELQLERIKGWTRLDFQATMDRLPADFKLAGDYQFMSGTGNTAIGGTSSVASWSTWSFLRDGTFSVNGGAAATSTAEGGGTRARVFSSSQSGARGGRYSIDGYVLTMRDSDGHDEVHLVVTDPTDPTVVWIDGDGYTRLDRNKK